MTMILSFLLIAYVIEFKNVVFPEPVPPEAIMVFFAPTSASINSTISGVED